MTPEERSAALAAAARTQREALIGLADALLFTIPAQVVSAPAAGSLMVELENAAGAFCFTEVVVTTAEVSLDGSNGWGCVLGFDREAALAAAILDARPDARLDDFLATALASEAAAREREASALVRTRV